MDDELERIKQRRLREMQRKMLLQQSQAAEPKKLEAARVQSNAEVLGGVFQGRAWEVYNAAKEQFPLVMPEVERILVDAVKAGKVNQKIDGESLVGFFRQIGLNVRLNTQIRFAEHGELKTLEQKLKSEE
ncbi:DNA-binding protein [Candidatus Bathyarchaeota archaeon]|nr:DNA-binding protein [Candidatus Bathyarchaeota archaeon]